MHPSSQSYKQLRRLVTGEQQVMLLLQIIEASGNGVMLLGVDPDLPVQWANDTMLQWLGTSPTQDIRELTLNCLDLPYYDVLKDAMTQSARSLKPVDLEVKGDVDATGHQQYFLTRVIPLTGSQFNIGTPQMVGGAEFLTDEEHERQSLEILTGFHGVTAFVLTFRDISSVKTTEKMRRDFVANVSHELRTPLSVLKGYAETLLGGALEDRDVAQGFVEVILRHADRLTTLVDDLLDLSRMESPDFQLDLEPVAIPPIVDRVIALLAPRAEPKNIHFVNQIPPDCPTVLGHAGSIEQILVNLMTNAVKYTPEGGSVEVRSQLLGQEIVQFFIKDTGIGIDTKHIPRLFERFYRVDKARSRELGGTGLGLAIVKHLVQLQGGAVGVTSRPGMGSEFSFTLRSAETTP